MTTVQYKKEIEIKTIVTGFKLSPRMVAYLKKQEREDGHMVRVGRGAYELTHLGHNNFAYLKGWCNSKMWLHGDGAVDFTDDEIKPPTEYIKNALADLEEAVRKDRMEDDPFFEEKGSLPLSDFLAMK